MQTSATTSATFAGLSGPASLPNTQSQRVQSPHLLFQQANPSSSYLPSSNNTTPSPHIIPIRRYSPSPSSITSSQIPQQYLAQQQQPSHPNATSFVTTITKTTTPQLSPPIQLNATTNISSMPSVTLPQQPHILRNQHHQNQQTSKSPPKILRKSPHHTSGPIQSTKQVTFQNQTEVRPYIPSNVDEQLARSAKIVDAIKNGIPSFQQTLSQVYSSQKLPTSTESFNNKQTFIQPRSYPAVAAAPFPSQQTITSGQTLSQQLQNQQQSQQFNTANSLKSQTPEINTKFLSAEAKKLLDLVGKKNKTVVDRSNVTITTQNQTQPQQQQEQQQQQQQQQLQQQQRIQLNPPFDQLQNRTPVSSQVLNRPQQTLTNQSLLLVSPITSPDFKSKIIDVVVDRNRSKSREESLQQDQLIVRRSSPVTSAVILQSPVNIRSLSPKNLPIQTTNSTTILLQNSPSIRRTSFRKRSNSPMTLEQVLNETNRNSQIITNPITHVPQSVHTVITPLLPQPTHIIYEQSPRVILTSTTSLPPKPIIFVPSTLPKSQINPLPKQDVSSEDELNNNIARGRQQQRVNTEQQQPQPAASIDNDLRDMLRMQGEQLKKIAASEQSRERQSAQTSGSAVDKELQRQILSQQQQYETLAREQQELIRKEQEQQRLREKSQLELIETQKKQLNTFIEAQRSASKEERNVFKAQHEQQQMEIRMLQEAQEKQQKQFQAQLLATAEAQKQQLEAMRNENLRQQKEFKDLLVKQRPVAAATAVTSSNNNNGAQQQDAILNRELLEVIQEQNDERLRRELASALEIERQAQKLKEQEFALKAEQQNVIIQQQLNQLNLLKHKQAESEAIAQSALQQKLLLEDKVNSLKEQADSLPAPPRIAPAKVSGSKQNSSPAPVASSPATSKIVQSEAALQQNVPRHLEYEDDGDNDQNADEQQDGEEEEQIEDEDMYETAEDRDANLRHRQRQEQELQNQNHGEYQDEHEYEEIEGDQDEDDPDQVKRQKIRRQYENGEHGEVEEQEEYENANKRQDEDNTSNRNSSSIPKDIINIYSQNASQRQQQQQQYYDQNQNNDHYYSPADGQEEYQQNHGAAEYENNQNLVDEVGLIEMEIRRMQHEEQQARNTLKQSSQNNGQIRGNNSVIPEVNEEDHYASTSPYQAQKDRTIRKSGGHNMARNSNQKNKNQNVPGVRLYQYAKEKQERRLEEAKNHEKYKEGLESSKCTFRPQIVSANRQLSVNYENIQADPALVYSRQIEWKSKVQGKIQAKKEAGDNLLIEQSQQIFNSSRFGSRASVGMSPKRENNSEVEFGFGQNYSNRLNKILSSSRQKINQSSEFHLGFHDDEALKQSMVADERNLVHSGMNQNSYPQSHHAQQHSQVQDHQTEREIAQQISQLLRLNNYCPQNLGIDDMLQKKQQKPQQQNIRPKFQVQENPTNEEVQTKPFSNSQHQANQKEREVQRRQNEFSKLAEDLQRQNSIEITKHPILVQLKEYHGAIDDRNIQISKNRYVLMQPSESNQQEHANLQNQEENLLNEINGIPQQNYEQNIPNFGFSDNQEQHQLQPEEYAYAEEDQQEQNDNDEVSEII